MVLEQEKEKAVADLDDLKNRLDEKNKIIKELNDQKHSWEV